MTYFCLVKTFVGQQVKDCKQPLPYPLCCVLNESQVENLLSLSPLPFYPAHSFVFPKYALAISQASQVYFALYIASQVRTDRVSVKLDLIVSHLEVIFNYEKYHLCPYLCLARVYDLTQV